MVKLSEYECADCNQKFDDKYMAALHYWRIHEEFLTTDDLCLRFRIDGQDRGIQ